jgi:hypothetical protein
MAPPFSNISTTDAVLSSFIVCDPLLKKQLAKIAVLHTAARI